MNYNPFHAFSPILHAWGFSNFPGDCTVFLAADPEIEYLFYGAPSGSINLLALLQ